MYNVSSYICSCIESLSSQSFCDFEAILVDDCSSDDTLTIAKKKVCGDPRFSFYKLSENSGQSIARNMAIDKALGEYILFLDSDDALTPDALEKISDRLNKQNLDCLYYSAQTRGEAGLSAMYHEDYSGRISFEKVATGPELFTFFEENNQFYPHGALQVVRRSLINNNSIRLYPGIIHEDVLYTFQVLVNSKRSSFLNEAVYIRTIRSGSTMGVQRRTIANIHGHLVCTYEMSKWLDDNFEDISSEFATALSMRIAAYRNLCVRDWVGDITNDEKAKYLDSLTPEDRKLFYTQVLGPGLEFLRNENCIHNTKAFRVGDSFLRFPRKAKSALGNLTAKKDGVK